MPFFSCFKAEVQLQFFFTAYNTGQKAGNLQMASAQKLWLKCDSASTYEYLIIFEKNRKGVSDYLISIAFW